MQPMEQNEDRIVLCLKISQPEWIEKLSNGSAWFGKINNYIEQAVQTGNNDQGDAYEGVFARCKASSDLVTKYRAEFGKDLEVIPDGEYVFLRRYSSRKFLAFCMYGIKNSELGITEIYKNAEGKLMGKFHYAISHKMYEGFLQDGSVTADVAGYYCSAGHMINAVESALDAKKLFWHRGLVSYDIDLNSEFFIEPNEEYQELFHKRKELQYQHEIRFLVPNQGNAEKGMVIDYIVPSTHSGNCARGELYIEGTAYVEKIG